MKQAKQTLLSSRRSICRHVKILSQTKTQRGIDPQIELWPEGGGRGLATTVSATPGDKPCTSSTFSHLSSSASGWAGAHVPHINNISICRMTNRAKCHKLCRASPPRASPLLHPRLDRHKRNVNRGTRRNVAHTTRAPPKPSHSFKCRPRLRLWQRFRRFSSP